MQKGLRLTKPGDFLAARQHGRSWSNDLLVLIAGPNDLDRSRFGFAVGRRVGNAVVRNKLRRRLREIARRARVRTGWDLVLIARRNAASADSRDLSRSMAALLNRAGILDS